MDSKILDKLYFTDNETCIVEVDTSISQSCEFPLTHDTLFRLGDAQDDAFKGTIVMFGLVVHNRHTYLELGYATTGDAKVTLDYLIKVRSALRVRHKHAPLAK